MGIMIVEANEKRVGKMALRLRWAKDRTFTFTAVAGSPTLTVPGTSDFKNGDRIFVFTTNTLPGGLIEQTKYFCKRTSNTTVEVSLTKGGASISPTNVGAGANYITNSSANAAADFKYLVVTADVAADKGNRLARLNFAGIKQIVDPEKNNTDDSDTSEVAGDELAVLFDNDGSPQGNTLAVLTGRTVMVIPGAGDLSYLWKIDNLLDNLKQVTDEDFADLGSYLLKRCR